MRLIDRYNKILEEEGCPNIDHPIFDEFELIAAEPDEDIDHFVEFDDAIVRATALDPSNPTNHLWTIVQAENTLYVSEGNRYVDRVHMWLVTKKPHQFQGFTFIWHEYSEEE